MDKFVRQFFPVAVCLILFVLFVAASVFFITQLINPFSTEKILIELRWPDVIIGFVLYFVTAVDYALIVGRMMTKNPGVKARLILNIGTCLGCFVGVSLVLFLWGFAKEVDWLIIALLVFAGSVMVKLAYESLEYFKDARQIWRPFREITTKSVVMLHNLTQGFTFWIPELGSPTVKKMSLVQLGSWSFLLPFIIGLDDFVGYMGAMTIYNVFSLLVGIFFADILIDIIIFVSPSFTKRMVENAILSLLAVYAFLYLMYKSFSEAIILTAHTADSSYHQLYLAGMLCVIAYMFGGWWHRHHKSKALKTNI